MTKRWPSGVMAVCATLVVLVIGSFYVVLGATSARVVAVTDQFRVPLAQGQPVGVAAGISRESIGAALRITPLDQGVFNAAMVDALAQNPKQDLAPWIKTLRRLGWRDLTSLQNIIAEAVRREDVGDLIAPADALLRENQVVAETSQVMNLAEGYGLTWPRVYALLKQNVSWRYDYLQRGASIVQPQVLDGRARTLQALQRSGDKLRPQEVRPFIAALVNAGRSEQADSIWRVYTGDRIDAVHDPLFRLSLATGGSALTQVPFSWSLNSGVGYSAEVSPDGLGHAILSIEWDGRGFPLFLSQQTSVTPGHYELLVRVESDSQSFGERISFQFRCGDHLFPFRTIKRPGSRDLLLTTIEPVACRFAYLDMVGNRQNTRREFSGAISAVRLLRNSPNQDER